MGIAKYINRLKYIDYMIKRKATGNLETFAKKNRLSKSSLSEILSEMKGMGFPIKYDRARSSYYYEEEGEMINSLFMKYGEILSREEVKVISPSEKLCFSPAAIFEICREQ
ncbi:hypothetical protein [Niabella sp.]|uniref:hypothetical protein n=1 Tax=Niabella sp. TaxID=1962976 RepID=UPI00260C810A|nr:hypothetical protein [Niabella sp.]